MGNLGVISCVPDGMPAVTQWYAGTFPALSTAHSTAAASPNAPAVPAAPAAGRQMGLTAFYQQTAKCLGCRRGLPGYKGPLDQAPGLCSDCSR
jgi:hypothetical protein